jgi:hypothetical protein
MSADMGSIAKQADKRGIAGFGEEFWKRHRETISGFWDAISDYFDYIDMDTRNRKKMKIYQDGMIAEREVAQKIVEEGIKSGSKNYELVLRLLKRGAVLVKTEDFKLVKEELDRLLAITKTKSTSKKLFAFIKYRLIKNRLLNKRDEFISRRIDETLNQDEAGILFLGAYHNIKKKLPKDIQIIEVKDREKVVEYQKLVPFYIKNKERFEELGRYLILPIKV